MIRTGPQTRRGYTLVELLVVMALMILLAALAAGVSYSGMIGSQKVISGADRASGWLLIAKQRALRDNAPRGVRFFLNAATAPGTGFISTEAQYIEQPDIWVPNPAQEGNPGGPRIAFVYQYNNTPVGLQGNALIPNKLEVYFISTNANDLTVFDSRVYLGDSLILPEFGTSYRIVSAPTTPSTPLTLGTPLGQIPSTVAFPTANCRKLVLSSMPDLGAAGTPDPTTISPPISPAPIGLPITMQTYKFAFLSQPQLLLGEPVLQLPAGVAIDYRVGVTPAVLGQPVDASGYRTWSTPAAAAVNPAKYNPPTTIGVSPTTDASGTYFDVVFLPSGQVLNNPNSMICLWVRDPEAVSHPRQADTAGQSDCDTRTVFDNAGEQALIVVSVKSGLINTQPVNPPPATPTLGYDPYLFARDGLSSGL